MLGSFEPGMVQRMAAAHQQQLELRRREGGMDQPPFPLLIPQDALVGVAKWGIQAAGRHGPVPEWECKQILSLLQMNGSITASDTQTLG